MFDQCVRDRLQVFASSVDPVAFIIGLNVLRASHDGRFHDFIVGASLWRIVDLANLIKAERD